MQKVELEELDENERMEFSWNGHQLKQYRYLIDCEGSYTIDYCYNADGIRTSVEFNSDIDPYYYRKEYILNGSQITGELLYEEFEGEVYLSRLTIYLYDENGTPIGMKYRTNSYAKNVFDAYFFEKNLQGDIVAVYNSNGTKLVSYTYDAWGNVTTTYSNGGASTAAQYNPFRYRGYYYDTETGWYYLQSRYYNPTWGRFINADGYINANGDIIGFNMFAYCSNNPVNLVDYTGDFAISLTTALLLFTGACLLTATVGIFLNTATLPDAIPVPDVSPDVLPYSPTSDSKESDIVKESEKDITVTPSNGDITYYHVTTPYNAAAIMLSGVMTGSKWENGYIYAWRKFPNRYAIKNSGAHFGVIISFKTNASFTNDIGIEDPFVAKYGPVVSTTPGPIVVWDVQIVG